MTTNTDQLLPLCYEIEGLICLINQRDSDVPEGIYRMIKDKLSLLSERVDAITPAPTPEAIPEATPDAEDISVAESAPETEEDLTEADEEAIARSALLEEEEDAEPNSESASEEESEPDAAEEEKPRRIIEAPVMSKFQVKYFSINDRYRFRRELFNDDEEEMEETLDVISRLSGADEVLDYLANDLCWDIESDTVKDFVSIVLSQK